MSDPLAIVTALELLPSPPTLRVTYTLAFVEVAPVDLTIDVLIDGDTSVDAMKASVNDAIIADAEGRGGALFQSRIVSLADVCGS